MLVPSFVTSFPRALVLATGLAVVFSPAACSSKDDDPPRNGVNDVLKACQIRAAWTRATSQKCLNCVAAAPSPACDCDDFKEFASLCKSQDDARRSDPSCTDAMELCSRSCAMNNRSDCACVEKCYAQSDTCKRVIAARDGCVADVCSPFCQ